MGAPRGVTPKNSGRADKSARPPPNTSEPDWGRADGSARPHSKPEHLAKRRPQADKPDQRDHAEETGEAAGGGGQGGGAAPPKQKTTSPATDKQKQHAQPEQKPTAKLRRSKPPRGMDSKRRRSEGILSQYARNRLARPKKFV